MCFQCFNSCVHKCVSMEKINFFIQYIKMFLLRKKKKLHQIYKSPFINGAKNIC